MSEQPVHKERKALLRRDLNDLVRDESGKVSPSKVGTLAGQVIAAAMLIRHGDKLVGNWDSMTVLFAVLIAPELFKKLMNMKYGNGHKAEPKPA